MKRVKFLVAVGSILIAMSSCTKEYTCACSFTDTTKNFEVKLEKMRRNDAITVCQDYNTFVGNCAIK